MTRPGTNEKTRQNQPTKWTGSMKSSQSEKKRKSLFMRPPLGVAMGPEVPAALEPEERSRNGCKKWQSRGDSLPPQPPQPPLTLQPGLPTNSIFSVSFFSNPWYAWRANKWPLIGEIVISSVPPSSSLEGIFELTRHPSRNYWETKDTIRCAALGAAVQGHWTSKFLHLPWIVKSQQNRIELTRPDRR